MHVVRSIVAVVAGYAAMVILITLVQETLFGGVGYHESGAVELAVAGLGTVLSAVAGGFLAGWIAGRREIEHTLVMCLLVVVETTALTLRGDLDGPWWFDLLAAASLLAGLLAGGALAARRRTARA